MGNGCDTLMICIVIVSSSNDLGGGKCMGNLSQIGTQWNFEQEVLSMEEAGTKLFCSFPFSSLWAQCDNNYFHFIGKGPRLKANDLLRVTQ